MIDAGNLLGKITNPMTVMIGVVRLIDGQMFLIFVRIFKISLFF